MVGNGGTVLFYVIRGRARPGGLTAAHPSDDEVIRRLVEFLQQSDFAGAIFTKEPMEGTFGFEQAKIDPASPTASPVEDSPRRARTHVSLFLSIFTIFAVRPSSSVIQLPMSAARNALPTGEIQLTAPGSRSSSSTPTTV